MAEAIEQRFHLKPQLIEGRGGVFEVQVDGVLVFSKKAEHRFPEEEEIFGALEQSDS